MALAAGARLGPYEILSALGAGGMGEVYRAHDPRLKRDVAIKILTTFTADPERLRRFEQEARAAAALNHPNILVIYDIGTHDGQPFVVSELLEGETLRAKVANGSLPLRKAVDHAIQIAHGLAAAHAKGIVHRDLKPANVFVTSDGRVKILDFGLAKLIDPRDAFDRWSSVDTGQLPARVEMIVGTASYMSPEQVRGDTLDNRSDIFSFGSVFYEMLTGRRAFDRPSPVETMSATINDEPPGLLDATPNLPPEIQLTLRHCLEKNPDDRFQSARDLAFQLTALSHGLSSGGRTPAHAESRSAVRRRAAVVALAVVSALVAGFIGGVRASRTSPPLYRQLTFRRGSIVSARLAPDGHTIVYGAAWDGKPIQLSSTRPESPDSRPLGLPDADILAISSSGEMAISLGRRSSVGQAAQGTLARLPLDAGAPREVLTDVEDADWSPDGGSLAVAHRVQGKYELEFPIGTVLYETGGWINQVRMSPDGTHVAFIDHPVYGDDRGAVCVIRRTGGSKQVLSDGWSSVTGLAWSATRNEIWFTAAEVGATASLHAVDLSGRGRLIMRSAGRLKIQDIDRDGRALLTEAKFRLRIGAIDPTSGSGKERDLSWLDGSVVTDLSADGRTLLINEQAAGGGTSSYAVFVRKTDGSPAIRIGEGSVATLSPDGTWAAAVMLESPPSITLLPTGVGLPRTLDRGGLVDYQAVTWFPDGRRVLLAGSEAGRGVRLWVQDIRGGQPEAVSAEGLRIAFSSRPISPDGRHAAVIDQKERVWLHPLNGGERPSLIEGLDAGDIPIRWSADGQSFYVFRKGELPGIVYRFHLADRRKERVAELAPSDPAGVRALTTVQTTPEGRLFLYTYSQTLSDLFLVSNLR